MPDHDPAAVEVAKDCLSVAILHSHEILKALDAEFPQVSVHEAREVAEANLARIIAAAYAKQTSQNDAAYEKVTEVLVAGHKKRLTTEREVREKLVKALERHSCCCNYLYPVGTKARGKCPRCLALVAAKELSQ